MNIKQFENTLTHFICQSIMVKIFLKIVISYLFLV